MDTKTRRSIARSLRLAANALSAFADYKNQVYLLRKGENEFKGFRQGRVKNKPRFNKPIGGVFWTSTLQGDSTEWLEWCGSEMPEWIGDTAILFDASRGKVAHIKKERDYVELAKNYPAPGLDPGQTYLDFEKMAKDYDALHVDMGYPGPFHPLYGWDAESTVWFNPKKLKQVAVLDVRNQCSLERRK